jgi:tetratricopeptide (TPR) repeat protein
VPGSSPQRAGKSVEGNRPGGEEPHRQEVVPKTSSQGVNRDRGTDLKSPHPKPISQRGRDPFASFPYWEKDRRMRDRGEPQAGVSKRSTEPITEADTAIHQVRRLADQGCYDEAECLCRRYLHEHPLEAEAHALLGVILAASNRDEEAIRHFRQALYLEPRQEASRAYLSALLTRKADAGRWTHPGAPGAE